MKNSIEIRQERAEIIGKADALLNLAKGESRDFTADEQTSYDGMMENIDKLAKDVEVVERQEKLNAEAASIPVSHDTQNIADSKEVREFSFIEAAKAAASGRVDGLVKEFDQEARLQNPGQDFRGVAIPYTALESRANSVVSATSNGVGVQSFTELMSAASVLVDAGANFYSGISASQKLPVISAITTDFKPENGTSAITPGGSMVSKLLSPNTCIAATNVSAASMVQSASMEQAFRNSMAKAVMSKLEGALLGQADDTVESFFKTTNAGTLQGPTGWTNSSAIAAAQTMIGDLVEKGNSLDNLVFLLNGNAYADLMAQIGASASGFSAGTANLVDKTFLNQKYFVSQNVGNGTSDTRARALCVDIAKVHLALFGGLDMLVDPYSVATSGGVRLIMTALVDGALAASSGKESAVNCIASA